MPAIAPIETPLIQYLGPTPQGIRIWLKDETQQHSGAFKFRGVWHLVSQLTAPTTLVTATTGNHGLATGLAAQQLGHKAVIFLPVHTPEIKIQKLAAYGATVEKVKGEYWDCVAGAKAYAKAFDGKFIHGFDDTTIMEGNRGVFEEAVFQVQEEVGIEDEVEFTDEPETRDLPFPGPPELILKSKLSPYLTDSFHHIIIPVGGGGLLGACLMEFDHREYAITAVQSEGAPALAEALFQEHRVRLKELYGEADGLLVDQVGETIFEMVQNIPQAVELVSDGEMKEAMRLLWQHHRIKTELAGASALAAVFKMAREERLLLGEYLCVLTGGNIDEERFQQIVQLNQ